MGLLIYWSFQGPPLKADARAVIEQMRKRALDLPFESVSELVDFEGLEARCRPKQRDEFAWLKDVARQLIWNNALTRSRHCHPEGILGFQIDVAPGSEGMPVYLAAYPKTIKVKGSDKPKRIRTRLVSWCGSGWCRTQPASHLDCGGLPQLPPGASVGLSLAGPRQGFGHLGGNHGRERVL